MPSSTIISPSRASKVPIPKSPCFRISPTGWTPSKTPCSRASIVETWYSTSRSPVAQAPPGNFVKLEYTAAPAKTMTTASTMPRKNFASIPNRILFLSGNLDDMVTELGLDRPDHFADFLFKGGFLELGDHHPLAEPPEIATFLAGWTAREPACDLIELLTASKALEDLVCMFFGLDKDMGCPHL